MSGGGGGGSSDDQWRPGAGGPVSGDDKCSIVEKTVLNSPVATAVAGLNVGDVLAIALETHPRKRVIARASNGQTAGAITSTHLVEIIECLEGGFEYSAEVLSATGGRVEIEIAPA